MDLSDLPPLTSSTPHSAHEHPFETPPPLSETERLYLRAWLAEIKGSAAFGRHAAQDGNMQMVSQVLDKLDGLIAQAQRRISEGP